MKIRNLMTRSIVCVGPSDSLQIAYHLMKDNDLRHLPVVRQDRKLIGMLTERDLLLHASWDGSSVVLPDDEVSVAMTTDLVTCRPDNDLVNVAEVMIEKKIDSMPVTNESGALLGLITASDFVELATHRQYFNIIRKSQNPFSMTARRLSTDLTRPFGSSVRIFP